MNWPVNNIKPGSGQNQAPPPTEADEAIFADAVLRSSDKPPVILTEGEGAVQPGPGQRGGKPPLPPGRRPLPPVRGHVTPRLPTLPTSPVVPSGALNGLQRLSALIGVGIAGAEFGRQASQWYIGEEGAIARAISDRAGNMSSLSLSQAYAIGRHVGFPSHLDTQAHIDYANELLSLKAGSRVDFRTMEPDALAGLIEAPWPDADTIRQNSAWLKADPENLDPEMSAPRRGSGIGPLSTTYATTRTAMARSEDVCRAMPGERHHEIPAELMDKHADFLNKIGYSLDYGLSRPNARAPLTGEPEALIRLPTSDAERTAMGSIPGCGDRPIHSGSHPEYTKAVDEQLKLVEEMFDRGLLDRAGARAMTGRLLNGIRDLLQSGRFANMNDPALAQAIRALVL